MKRVQWIQSVVISSIAALLAACGGGGGGSGSAAEPDKPVPQVAWASPAMILSVGETTKTIALEKCDDGYESMSLAVNASGDMILNGSFNGGPFGVLRRINFDDSSKSIVKGQNTQDGPGVNIEMVQGIESMAVSVGFGDDTFYSFFEAGNITCNVANPSTAFSLKSLPSSTRLASQLLNGVTGLTARSAPTATFSAGVAYWDSWSLNAPSMPSQAQIDIRHFSLNIGSGAFGMGPNPNAAGTAYNITIPTTPTSTNAFFEEIKQANTKKFIAIVDGATPSAAPVVVCLFREDDLLTPNDANNCQMDR